jgi:hypothetical protein
LGSPVSQYDKGKKRATMMETYSYTSAHSVVWPDRMRWAGIAPKVWLWPQRLRRGMRPTRIRWGLVFVLVLVLLILWGELSPAASAIGTLS